MRDLGDVLFGSTVDFSFTTTAAATGVPTTLAGTPALAVYPANSTTELTAGITLTVDHDGRTGRNQVRLVLTDAAYTRRRDYEVAITAGTVGGASAVGYTVARFSIENRAVAGLRARGVCPSSGSHSTTVVVLPSSIDYPDGALIGDILSYTDGTNRGRKSTITGWVNSTKAATVSPPLGAPCDNTTGFDLLVGPLPVTDPASLPLVRDANPPFKKNTAGGGFLVYMELVGGGPAIGKTITAQRALGASGGWGNGGLGAITEVGDGLYRLASWSAADVNDDTIGLKFVGDAATRPRVMTLRTQP